MNICILIAAVCITTTLANVKYGDDKKYGSVKEYGKEKKYGYETRDRSGGYKRGYDDFRGKKAYGSEKAYGKEEKYGYESIDKSYDPKPKYGYNDKDVVYSHGFSYYKPSVYHGKYNGVCDNDGFYYRDSSSFVICSNNNAYVQPCAPGSRNSGIDSYNYGGNYSYRHFCDVNLVDYGYAIHGKRFPWGGE